MSVDLNKRIEISTYLNEQNCEKILEQSLASAVKKLSDLVDIENLQNTEKRKCYEQKKKEKLIEELKALNNIIKSINVYLDLID
jgi:endo-alpha-1,4-polygalactosaminidase (GH114 family)